jgi:hypothetical protein
MDRLVAAEAGAQFLSLLVFGTIAIWYVAPWLNGLGRAEALIALLWLHVFKYVSLQGFGAQRDGFPISDGELLHIVVGYLSATLIALAAILALRRRARLGITLAWLLVAETIFNTGTIIRGGIEEHALGAARGVTWLIVCVYVPVLMVGLVLLIWQLISRRAEPLAD